MAAWLAERLTDPRIEGAALLARQGHRTRLLGRIERSADQPLVVEALSAVGKHFKRGSACLPIGGEDSTVARFMAARVVRIKGRPCLLALQFISDGTEPTEQVADTLLRSVLRRETDHPEHGGHRTALLDRPASTSGPSTSPDSPNSLKSSRSRNAPLPTAPEARAPAQRLALELSTGLLEAPSLEQASHRVCALLARRLNARRVTLALRKNGKLRLAGMSDSASFDAHTDTAQAILIALQETCELGRSLRCDTRLSGEPATNGHRFLADNSSAAAVVSVPLAENDDVIGAILLELDAPLGDSVHRGLEQASLLLAPQIRLKRLEDLGWLSWLWLFSRRTSASLLGPSWLPAKIGLIALTVLVIFGALWPTTFKVTANASVQATEQRAVVATYNSFLTEVHRDPGDAVSIGDLLARLDASDLESDRAKWLGEREKIQREFRASLATRDRSNARVLEARRAQAQAELDLVESQIARAALTAPMDGVIVSGDLRQNLGSPIERGQLLFEVASLDRYELVLMVDEADIDWIKPGQSGQVRLEAIADQTFEFTVETVTPVSEQFEGSNAFRVLATLSDESPILRPGMAGVSHVAIDERPIGWTWTRRFAQWVSLTWWTWVG